MDTHNIRSKLNWVIGALEGLVDGGGSTEYVNVGSQYLTILSVKLQQCLNTINQYDLLSGLAKSDPSVSEIPTDSNQGKFSLKCERCGSSALQLSYRDKLDLCAPCLDTYWMAKNKETKSPC